MKAEFDVQIPAPAKLLTVNAERRLHWSKRAEIVKLWREASCAYAKYMRAPHCEAIVVTVTIEQHLGQIADHHAHTPVVKACIDGLVDAGVIDDDDPGHCVVEVMPPERSSRDCVKLHVVGVTQPLSRVEPKVTWGSLAAAKRERIAKEQKDCVHAKRLLGVCIECGHGASR